MSARDGIVRRELKNSFFFFFENAGELCFIVLKRKGGPQHDPHSYGDQI